MQWEPIGTVVSPVREGVDAGWGGVLAEVHVRSDLAGGLRGLAEFSHAVILFYMHEATFDLSRDLARRPRERADLPLTGIFAQRAKHRPNPIGLTAVEIVSVDGAVLRVRGLDAIDGSPVLDIKPYVPAFDRREGARVPAWMTGILEGYF